MTTLDVFGNFVSSLNAGTLPADVIAVIENTIVDCFGCGVAGTQTVAGQVALDYARQYGGRGGLTATIWGGGMARLNYAAFVNTLLVNALDFEPVGPEGHVCASVLPTVLAVGEAVQATGKEIIAAIAAGLEVGGRVGASIRRPTWVKGGHFTPAVQGMPYVILGSTAAAAKLMKLQPDQIANALAIAAYSAPIPTMRLMMESPHVSMTKYDHLAEQSRLAIEAVQLAERGFLGDKDVLDSEWGFWRIVGASGCDYNTMTSGLGERWCMDEIWFKRYPAVLYVGPALDAVRELIAKNNLELKDITNISIWVRNPKEGQRRKTALTELDAWLSFPLNVATSILDIQPRYSWQKEAVFSSRQIVEISSKVEVEKWLDDFPLPPQGQGPWSGWSPCKVLIKTGDATYEKEILCLPIITREELLAKCKINLGCLLKETEKRNTVLEYLKNISKLNNLFPLTGYFE